jgi:hypothetical protein
MITSTLIESIMRFGHAIITNPKNTAITTAIVLALYGIFSIGQLTAELADPTPKHEQELFGRALHADQEINSTLDTLLTEFNADRVSIRQFSNNTRNIAGIPWAFVSTSHYTVRPGVALPDIQRFPLSTMNHSLLLMWGDIREPKCVSGNISNNESLKLDMQYLKYLQEHGVDRFIVCPIVSLEGYPIGFIGVDYLKGSQAPEAWPDALIETKLASIAAQVGGYIEGVVIHDTYPWYTPWFWRD